MSPSFAALVILGYFLLLICISVITTRRIGQQSFYNGDKQSPWFIVAFGMIGASLSGVTFISIPGAVGTGNWSYFQIVLGYIAGYWVIRKLLLPLYYKLNLISIYGYLAHRFGPKSYFTGASFFILSRLIGSAFRLYIVALVLQIAVFDPLGLPFYSTVLLTIALIWVYTFKGGIKTIVWTDTLQTFFMLTAVSITIYLLASGMGLSPTETMSVVSGSRFSEIFVTDFNRPDFFIKQFLAGMFITIVMTGLDQDMMQKNLTCRSLKDAQKNMFWFSIVLVGANILFLSLGTLLYEYCAGKDIAIPIKSDDLYPMLSLHHLGGLAALVFLLGVVAAAYSSADSTLTALTTTFCVDILGMNSDALSSNKSVRTLVHIAFSLLLGFVVIGFEAMNDSSTINAVFTAAGYTYGPILGLFAFGLFSKRNPKDLYVPLLAVISPVICYMIQKYSVEWLKGYKFGFELLILNGAITYIGLYVLSLKKNTSNQ